MRIEVTAEDIVRGEGGRATRCPIALALTREFGGTWSVWAGSCRRKVRRRTVHELPRETIGFIADFDAGLPVAPFAFEVELD